MSERARGEWTLWATWNETGAALRITTGTYREVMRQADGYRAGAWSSPRIARPGEPVALAVTL